MFRRRLAALFLAGAFLLRMAWTVLTHNLAPLVTENQRVAASLAEHGTFADAFGPGLGPTAHVGIFTPQMAALVYALFGVGSIPAELILTAISCGFVVLSFWLAWRCFEALAADGKGLLVALAIVCFFPLQFSLEVRELRIGEQVIGACFLLGLLLVVLKMDAAKAPAPTRKLVLLGLAIALAFFFSPSVGLAAAGMFGLLFLQRRAWQSLLILGGTAAAATAFVGAGWAIRNERALGAPVWLRSNVGLEMALANHDGAVAPADPKKDYLDRLLAIHPHASAVGMAKLKAAGGEIAYNRMLLDETKAWIRTHPGDFRTLLLHHAVEFYVPPRWFWGTFGSAGSGVALRQAVLVGTALLGLFGLPFLIWVNRRYAYVAIALLLPVLPYLITQPILRYRYLISTLLIFLALDAATRLIRYAIDKAVHRKAVRPA
ncbi:hypothetical protein [Sphingomonas sp.]|uniref:hypothetical protein n=1 Tax=Sphingomonas sp. TaxID=28214 RepID=UPI0028AF8D46|nr:hypothetical protein [Sphingomonas sp.]